ncbi:MAG: YihY family inner membrane protein [Gemmatimonadales bacterium]|nr:MAG: YihY family inner membrane protein [Gemmatimonadales bacterium]
MAGAITFNVMVAIVPLLILTAGVAGFFVTTRFGQVEPEVVEVVLGYLPATGANGLRDTVDRVLEGLVSDRAGLSIVGGVVLAWISTRLVASLRIVLRNIFHEEEDRGLVRGKLFDFQVVVLAGTLIVVNFAITIAVRTVEALGLVFLGPEARAAVVLQWGVGWGLSLASAWILFFLLYRYLPARKVAFRTAVAGATFAAVGFELLKGAFAWYVTQVADYSSAYGSLAVAAILFFWIYYSAVLFILGGVVARTYEVRREAIMERKTSVATGSGSATVLVLLTIAASAFMALPASAQSFAPFGGNGNAGGLLDSGDGVVYASRSLEREMSLDRPLVDHDGPYVVVHIAENRVLVLEGTEVVWSAQAGTGHGFQLAEQGREWTFTTPVGMFRVLRREKDPVWIAPDWYFIQNGMSIPAQNHPSRYIANTLGTSALYLGDGIAIHGTDRPHLLLDPDPETRRISHGCIRLTNEAARQLYHRVEVGTPVLIF